MNENISQEWLEFCRGFGLRSMPWSVQGGDQWVSYLQTDENDFLVQICTNDDTFIEYKKQKDAIVGFFAQKNSILVKEHDVKQNIHCYWKELSFMSRTKVEELKRVERERMAAISIGNIYAPGGVVNLGTISDSPISIDNTVHQIEKMIEEHGGEDKAVLRGFLEETKAMVEEYVATSQIKPQKGFTSRLSAHVVKHEWFYGAILQLLGTAAIQIIG